MLPEELKPLLDDLKNQPEFSLDTQFDWGKYFHFPSNNKLVLPLELSRRLDDLKNQPEFSIDFFDWEKHFHIYHGASKDFGMAQINFDEYLP